MILLLLALGVEQKKAIAFSLVFDLVFGIIVITKLIKG